VQLIAFSLAEDEDPIGFADEKNKKIAYKNSDAENSNSSILK